jgi:tRNA dimethylallyltransferase
VTAAGAGAAPVLHIVCGPTAAGKSALAMALARRHGLTIISADSRQVYRGFDIGTAKPSAADRAAVPHLGIDVAEPTERWSAARWADDAARWIAELGAERVLVVGGTGLYLRALTAPFFAEPPLDPVTRAAVAKVLDEWTVPELRRWVQRLDPARAHLGRTQLLRSLEIALLAGRRLSELHRDAETPARVRARWLVVDPGPALQEQIGGRLDAMLAGGWVDEARALAARVPESAPAWQACGYAAVREVAAGTRDLAEARAAILVETRQYAKRQRTWFRHQLEGADVVRLDPRAPGAHDAAVAWWQSEERA